jgi:hypothetical protein
VVALKMSEEQEIKVTETESVADVVEEKAADKRSADHVVDDTEQLTKKVKSDKKKKKSRHSRYADLEEPKTDSDDSDEDKDPVDDEKLIVEDEEEDDLAEIDVTNIITQGRRTRGKVIDYSKVDEELKQENKDGNEDDEDEDDDFKEKEEPN